MDEWRLQISQGQNHKDGEYPGEAEGWFLTSGHRQGSVPKSPISKTPVPAQKSQSFARRRCSALYRSIRQEKPDNLGTLPKKDVLGIIPKSHPPSGPPSVNWGIFCHMDLLLSTPPLPLTKVLKPTVSREL